MRAKVNIAALWSHRSPLQHTLEPDYNNFNIDRSVKSPQCKELINSYIKSLQSYYSGRGNGNDCKSLQSYYSGSGNGNDCKSLQSYYSGRGNGNACALLSRSMKFGTERVFSVSIDIQFAGHLGKSS